MHELMQLPPSAYICRLINLINRLTDPNIVIKIDSRTIFGFFRDPGTADPTQPDPSDKKKGHEIDSFKGNLSKNTKFRKYSTKSLV